MPQLPIYYVDAFASRVFRGNPAAVCPLEAWLPDATMQAIAQENNLSETAFFVPRGDGGFELRWFTPACEIDLCGHATLASAYVLFEELDHSGDVIAFHSPRSGALSVARDGARLALDFPARPPQPHARGDQLASALGVPPAEVHRSDRWLAVYAREAEVRAIAPDAVRLAPFDKIIVTAPGDDGDIDFVSRFFAPGVGILEDPVTGSAHCTLIPYWARRLGKASLRARQVSARTGELWCEHRGERVRISGHAACYLRGTIQV